MYARNVGVCVREEGSCVFVKGFQCWEVSKSTTSSNNNNKTAVKQSAPVHSWNRRTSGNSDQIVTVVVCYSFTGVRAVGPNSIRW